MRELVLVGLGHAHMQLLARLSELGGAFRVTVVAPHDGRYGGAAASLLAGEITADRLRRSPPSNVVLVANRALGCQPLHRRLWLADGCVLDYDALSVNTGTRRLPLWAARPGACQPRAWSGHSMRQLIVFQQVLAGSEQSSIVIAGGSCRALEIAGGLSRLYGRSPPWVTLLCPDGPIRRAERAARRRLAWYGVDIAVGAEACALGEGCVLCTDGRRFRAEHVVWAGPAEPDGLARSMALPIAGPGLCVDRRLRSPQAAAVHAAGAIATLDGQAVLPGWDAERQARVLLTNLRAMVGRYALARYRAPSVRQPLDLGGDDLVSSRRLFRWLGQRRLRTARRTWLI